VSEELAVSIGLIAMIGALAELKIENLWIELQGPAAAIKKGPSPNVTQNLKDCKEFLDSLDTGKEYSEPHRYERHYRDKGVHLLEQAEKAFESRNDLVHRSGPWPMRLNRAATRHRHRDEEMSKTSWLARTGRCLRMR
jgi:hypothetical protein